MKKLPTENYIILSPTSPNLQPLATQKGSRALSCIFLKKSLHWSFTFALVWVVDFEPGSTNISHTGQLRFSELNTQVNAKKSR